MKNQNIFVEELTRCSLQLSEKVLQANTRVSGAVYGLNDGVFAAVSLCLSGEKCVIIDDNYSASRTFGDANNSRVTVVFL